MTDRDIMQQALDALEIAEVDGNCCYEATELLRARLAQPEQEPYGYVSDDENLSFQKEKPEIGRWIKVFTAAPAQRKPLPYGEWPKKPSPYVNDEYKGYSKSDLHDYAMQVLEIHGIKEGCDE